MPDQKQDPDPYHHISKEAALRSIRGASERATLEPKGPSGSLRCDGMVGLGSESVEKLLSNWDKMAAHWHTNALACEPDQKEIKDRCLTRWSIYGACALELRAEMERAIERQPRPNA